MLDQGRTEDRLRIPSSPILQLSAAVGEITFTLLPVTRSEPLHKTRSLRNCSLDSLHPPRI